MSRLRAAYLLTAGLALGLGAGVGCFQAPADDVLFACEPDGANGTDACPSGYRCESDGCCHKVGSDVEANMGACALGGETEGFPTPDTGTDGGTDTGTDGGTDTGTGGSTDTGTGG